MIYSDRRFSRTSVWEREGSEWRGMMEREDEEGADEGRGRCLNAFWAVGRRFEGRCFRGGIMLVPKTGTEKEDNGWMKRMDVVEGELRRPHGMPEAERGCEGCGNKRRIMVCVFLI